jgi:hypothetical protein
MQSVTSHSTCCLFKAISKFYMLILFLLLFIAASSISAPFTKARAQEQAPSSNGAQLFASSEKPCCGQDKDQPHLLAASYYNVGNNLTATLMLNNKGPEPVEVKPTFFSLSGERLESAPVIVAGESFRNIDLRELGARPGTAFQEGSLQLFHRGPDLVIGAQLYLVDEAHRLSFDEKLVEFGAAPSTQLESVWWLPSRKASVGLILSNTSYLEVAANVVINAGTPHPETVDVTLSPHETRVIKVEREKPGNGPNLRDNVGSASIHHSGVKGSLLARALIEDSSSGYSFSSQFYSPQGGKSSNYQGAGLRLTTPAGEELKPVVVARNVCDETSYLAGRVAYTTTDAQVGVVQLPKTKLEPGEAASLDIERAIGTQILSRNIAAASLEFDYTTAPGSVIIAAESVSSNGDQVFRVPMWDVPAQRSGTGGYPWFIEGDSSTFVYIKNVTDKEQQYTFSLTYEGGDYSLGLKSIKGSETVAFDLRAMRDNQVPEERGQTIPLDAKRGKIVWSVRGPDSLALLGRSEQVDLVKGTSSSYACVMCCPNSFRRAWIEPGELGLEFGSTGGVHGVQQDRTCYGSLTPAYYMGDTWSVDNPVVLTVVGSGSDADITATGVGTANVEGSWEVYQYESVYNYEQGYKECVVYSSVTEPSGGVAVKPRISGSHTMWWFNGETPTGYQTEITLTTSANGQWSITSGSDKVSFTGNGTSSITLRSTARSISPNDVTVQVTINGRTSDPFQINILAPYSLTFVAEGTTASQANGYTTLIQYQIRDQFGSLLPSTVPINENFTTGIINDYPGTNWIRAGDGGTLVSPSGWSDQIAGQPVNGAIPAPSPPCSPYCNVLVHHFNGDWYVGSTIKTKGVKVQTNTWNRFRDHGSHTNVVSPVP